MSLSIDYLIALYLNIVINFYSIGYTKCHPINFAMPVPISIITAIQINHHANLDYNPVGITWNYNPKHQNTIPVLILVVLHYSTMTPFITSIVIPFAIPINTPGSCAFVRNALCTITRNHSPILSPLHPCLCPNMSIINQLWILYNIFIIHQLKVITLSDQNSTVDSYYYT